MTCAQVNEQLVDYLYEELPVSQRQLLEQHLSGCDACRSEVTTVGRTLGRARQALRGPLSEEPPARVHAAVLAAARTAAVAPRVVASPPGVVSRPEAEGALGALWAWLKRPWFLPAFAAVSALAIFILARPALVKEESLSLPEGHGLPAAAPAPAAAPQPVAEEPASAAPSAPEMRAADSDPLVGVDLGESSPAASAPRPPKRAPPRPRRTAPSDQPLRDVVAKEKSPSAAGLGRLASAPAAKAEEDEGGVESESGVESGAALVPAEAQVIRQRVSAESERKGRVGAPTGAASASAGASAPAVAAAAPAAAPPPARPKAARNFAEPPPPASAPPVSVRDRQTRSVADDTESSGSLVEKASPPPLPLAELQKRAAQALRDGRPAQAAADYRELLRRFPEHRDVAFWRRQLDAALAASRP